MIARLSGEVLALESDTLVVGVGGVGYEVLVPPVVSAGLRVGEACALHTVHYIQMEQSRATPVLVGFASDRQKRFWETLAGVLGPRVAAKCYELPEEQIALWIESGDVASLKRLNGVGQAKARELVGRLQGKLAAFAGPSPAGAPPGTAFGLPASGATGPAGDAIEALMGLDYPLVDARALVARALQADPELDTPQAILDAVFRRR